jgi:YD repeat-containing protein
MPAAPACALLKNEETLINEWTYNDHNHLLSQRPAGGGEWTYEYDLLDRLKKVTKPGASGGQVADFEVISRDGRGNVTTVRDAAGKEWERDYNFAGQVTETRSPLGSQYKTTYAYNTILGRTLTATDARNHSTVTQRDARLLLSQITDAKNQSLTLGYDDNGNLVSRTDRDGKGRTFEYTSRDLLKKVTAGDGGVFEYYFDKESRLRKLTAPNSLEIVNQYTKLSRRTATAIKEGATAVDQRLWSGFNRNGLPSTESFAAWNGGDATPNYTDISLSYNARQ